jgi:molybdopterin molybdotransferase
VREFIVFHPILAIGNVNGVLLKYKSKRKMVTVKEATDIILQNCYLSASESVPITESVGRVLSEGIIADRDFPPFDRVSMDGIALSFDQLKTRNHFIIENMQAAGEPVKELKDKSKCIEVMTGAVLPLGTDTVIRYEDLTISNGVVNVSTESVQQKQSIHAQAQDARKGEMLIEAGIVISPAEVALLATVGKPSVSVRRLPRAAIVASGDELVAIESDPKPHQIRRSNTFALEAAMKKLGWAGTQYHFPDDLEVLRKSLKTLVTDHDVVILSGGVSKGKFDFIPQVLKEIGVKQLFHQISQRPGKPVWFGVTNDGKVVFALPGNPVSTFMCFHRFIKPWLLKSIGIADQFAKAILGTDFKFEPQLTYFLQVAVKNEEGKLVAYPKAGGGSGDFANLKEVDGFLELPLEKTLFKAGEVYPFIPFR